jgi:TRAP-type C4-dicarboxylate transport system permease large subunit
VIGPIIPPSIILIFYGAWMQVSIGGLFAAGIIPGLLLGVVLLIANAVFAHRQDHPGGRGTQVPHFWSSFMKSSWRWTARRIRKKAVRIYGPQPLPIILNLKG